MAGGDNGGLTGRGIHVSRYMVVGGEPVAV